jgi:hypothetical protein
MVVFVTCGAVHALIPVDGPLEKYQEDLGTRNRKAREGKKMRRR